MSYKTLKYGNINLTKEISSGGEGTAYFTDKGVVAKIYHPNKNNQNKHEKLKQMMQTNSPNPYICFPLDILTDQNNKFVGYIMPKAEGEPLKNLLTPEREIKFPDIQRKNLVKLCLGILEIFEYLHKLGIIIGDINPHNILINEKGIFVIDTDSFQIGNYPCPGGTPEFTAPEIQGKNFETFMRTKEHEYFAIAVLLFQVLFVGKHPYSKIGGGGVAENIKNQDFVYPLDLNDGSKIPPGNWKNIWGNFPYEVKKGFYQTFKENKRLNIQDWTEILGNYLKALEKGLFVNEIFPNKIDKQENFEEIKKVSRGLLKIKQNGKYGIIDKSGILIHQCIYDEIIGFSEGYAGAVKNGKAGFIDDRGNETSLFIYDSVKNYLSGKAEVLLNGKRYFIDYNGNIDYNSLESYYVNKNATIKDTIKEIINPKGRLNRLLYLGFIIPIGVIIIFLLRLDFGFFFLPLLIISFILVIKRLHDIGLSGYYLFILVLLLVLDANNIIKINYTENYSLFEVFLFPIIIILGLVPGTKGDNKFGPESM